MSFLNKNKKSDKPSAESRTDHSPPTQAVLVKDEPRFEYLLRNSPVVIYTCKPEGDFAATYISENVRELFGYKPTDFTGNPSFWAEGIHPEDAQQVFHGLKALFEKGYHHHEYRFRNEDGSYRWVYDELKLVCDRGGTPIEIIGYWADVTEKRQALDDLKLAKREAEQANRAKTDFLSHMSHELRTPMNAVLGFSELLRNDQENPLSKEQMDSVNEVIRAGQHLMSLIDDVLDLARIESKNIEVVLEHISLEEVIAESLAILNYSSVTTGIKIYENIKQAKGQYLLADRTRLIQVIVNLLSNAIKYNRPGGTVRIDYEKTSHGRTRIAVQDTGFGIRESERHRLFKPFVRLGQDGDIIGGTGIGLVISKNLVELMNGNIGFESSEDSGSIFWIEIPNAKILGSNKQESGRWTRGASHALPENRNYSVIYIEDNAANMKLVEALFRKHPQIQFLKANNGLDGLEIINRTLPDLVLLDLNLPKMDGFEVLDNMKRNEETKHIPVVAISANARTKDVARGVEAGFEDYLTKPLDIDVFYRVMNRVLVDPGELGTA